LKRISVQLDDSTHKALKQYSAFYEKTMSEVLQEMFHMQFQRHANWTTFVEHIKEQLSVKTEKRLGKPCYSFACFSCQHEVACKTGVYEGTMEPKPHIERLLKPEALQRIAEWHAERESESQADS